MVSPLPEGISRQRLGILLHSLDWADWSRSPSATSRFRSCPITLSTLATVKIRNSEWSVTVLRVMSAYS